MFDTFLKPIKPLLKPFRKVGGFAPHLLEWCLGPPGPPKPQKSAISGRPNNHVLETQSGQTLRGLRFIIYIFYLFAVGPQKHKVPTNGT